MKNKKLLFIFIIISLIIIIGLLIFFLSNIKPENNTLSEEISDYTPEEEISDTQMRETMVTLYFINSESSELQSESRLLNASELVEKPYETIIQLLIDGPKSDTLSSPFPDNTKLLNIKLDNNCAMLNFSDEILNFKDENQKYFIINSLLNTITQLNEVNSIKILVNDESVEAFNEEYSEL